MQCGECDERGRDRLLGGLGGCSACRLRCFGRRLGLGLGKDGGLVGGGRRRRRKGIDGWRDRYCDEDRVCG